MYKILLYDKNKRLCEAWKKEFKNDKNVKVQNCEFKDLKYERVVTAGNSYGIMNGGIDLAVREYYGINIQDSLQWAIRSNSKLDGYLPVGGIIEIKTSDCKKPKLIYAPTMRIPQKIDKVDVFYVFVKLLNRYNNFACCGLGTGTGEISEKECAKQMKLAYDYVLKERGQK